MNRVMIVTFAMLGFAIVAHAWPAIPAKSTTDKEDPIGPSKSTTDKEDPIGPSNDDSSLDSTMEPESKPTSKFNIMPALKIATTAMARVGKGGGEGCGAAGPLKQQLEPDLEQVIETFSVALQDLSKGLIPALTNMAIIVLVRVGLVSVNLPGIIGTLVPSSVTLIFPVL